MGDPRALTIETSALLAILQGEPERAQFLESIGNAAACRVSAMSVLEASILLEQRRGAAACTELDQFLREAEIGLVAFDQRQVELARIAFRRFGEGRHPAGLNFGDCAAYALARSFEEPLLFKGSDFAKTDVVPAAAVGEL